MPHVLFACPSSLTAIGCGTVSACASSSTESPFERVVLRAASSRIVDFFILHTLDQCHRGVNLIRTPARVWLSLHLIDTSLEMRLTLAPYALL
jgi:hypothetical protein